MNQLVETANPSATTLVVNNENEFPLFVGSGWFKGRSENAAIIGVSCLLLAAAQV